MIGFQRNFIPRDEFHKDWASANRNPLTRGGISTKHLDQLKSEDVSVAHESSSAKEVTKIASTRQLKLKRFQIEFFWIFNRTALKSGFLTKLQYTRILSHLDGPLSSLSVTHHTSHVMAPLPLGIAATTTQPYVKKIFKPFSWVNHTSRPSRLNFKSEIHNVILKGWSLRS